MSSFEQEITLDEIMSVLSRFWKLILIPSFILAVATYIFLKFFSGQVYQSYSLLRMGGDGSGSFETVSSVEVVMRSIPMLKEISRRLGLPDGTVREESITYIDAAGMLKIQALSDSPDKAYKLVSTATDIITERHAVLFKLSQSNLDNVVKYVKETIKPIPLSSGINEFKIIPTSVLIAPIFEPKPMPSEKLVKVISVFLVSLIITAILSFYIAGKEKIKL